MLVFVTVLFFSRVRNVSVNLISLDSESTRAHTHTQKKKANQESKKKFFFWVFLSISSAMTSSYSEAQRERVFAHLERLSRATTSFARRNDEIHKGSVLCVDGNIGVGKSSLCRNLATHFQGTGRKAFVAKETVLKGWLETFYGDQKKWAAEFQNNQLNLCINAINVAHARCDTENAIAIVDRSPVGNDCFFLTQRMKENIDDKHTKLYEESFTRCGPYMYSRAIYLDACVDTIYGRIQARIRSDPARQSEKNITKEYLRSLDEMMILVELFLHYKGVLPVTFLRWEDYTTPSSELMDLIGRQQRLRNTTATSSRNGERSRCWRPWLLKASYQELKERVSELSLVPESSSSSSSGRRRTREGPEVLVGNYAI